MCTFDKDKGARRLMKKGLTLILVGHINFILGAIVHGNVLRHISQPSEHITTEYTMANIISVTSGLLSILTGVIAILVSRNLPMLKLQVGLLVCSFFNALMSAACSVGLLVAVGLTIAHNGQLLMRGCNETEVPANARSAVGSQCPFDNTKIYDTALALWISSVLLAMVEVGLSVWCFSVGLTLRGLAPCGNHYIKEQLEEGALSNRNRAGAGFPTQGQILIERQNTDV
ncbi:keratinocyte-associated protein 3 [Gadus morhua]|uniref:Keratinocyte-associated protein 3-like n=1 Tax=Gadus morhua TaxID=8049 RepID=A0A8C5FH04_GADMO|nr:keratinocyte-associated protein 3-like [Gadus morhua]XP_056463742.1 keratinocyte-associated protein 3 [Gadus chalcogrammus]XP_059927286.1 keratinocyte-associated protein 3 [Gadus macrocephalus]